MPDPDLAGAVQAVRAALQRTTARTATPKDIEMAVLAVCKQRDLSHQLVRESYEICHRARASIRTRLRARYGMRSPRSGAMTIGMLVLLFAAIAPLGLLNAVRLHTVDSVLPAAVSAAAVGGGTLALALAAGFRPVARNVVLQVCLILALVGGASAIGASLADGAPLVLFLVGGGTAVLAAALVFLARARDKAATAEMDTAYARAHLDVAPEVAAERDRMIAELPDRLAARGADVAAIRRLRAAAFDAFGEEGNPAADTEPASMPGSYIVMLETENWIPMSQRPGDSLRR